MTSLGPDVHTLLWVRSSSFGTLLFGGYREASYDFSPQLTTIDNALRPSVVSYTLAPPPQNVFTSTDTPVWHRSVLFVY